MRICPRTKVEVGEMLLGWGNDSVCPCRLRPLRGRAEQSSSLLWVAPCILYGNRCQRGIMGGAEQLPLFDSPVSGMVLAPHQGAKQECNRPDQLRQCRDHCYSDLGFLLPVITSPPSGLAVVFGHCPVTSSQRNRSPAGIRVSRGGAVEAALSSHCVQSSLARMRDGRCHKLPLRGPLLRHPREGGHTGVMNARTNTTRRMCGSIRARMCS